MKFSKLILISFVLSFGSKNIYGCVCGKAPSTEEYDYIALVEITGVLKSDLYSFGSKDNLPKPIFHEVKIKTIEQYFGRNEEYLIVHGGNQKYNVGVTSCDMNMEIGEKWIIYGMNFKSKISTNYCSLSILHVNSVNEIDYKNDKSTQRLNNLISTFTSRKMKNPIGINHITYPNQKTKLKEEYDSNHNLIGKRQAFYSSNQLMLDEFYKKGKRVGNLYWFHRDGKSHRVSTFENGKEICETYYYNYSGELSRINYFDDEGNYLTTQKMPDDNK